MIFPTSSSFSSSITLPSARKGEYWPSILDLLIEAVESNTSVFLNASQSESSWVAYLEAMEPVHMINRDRLPWGEVFAAALLHDNPLAAQAVLVATSAMKPDQSKILDSMVGYLEKEGRLDLFRPGISLVHDFCQGLWRFDKPSRQDFLSLYPGWMTRDMPDPNTLSHADRQAVDEEEPRRGIRAAKIWWSFCDQLPQLIKDSHEKGQPDIADIFPVLVNALETMPALRPFAASSLIFFARSFLWTHMPNPFGRDLWNKTPRVSDSFSLMHLLTDKEAIVVLRRLSDMVSLRQRNHPPGTFVEFDMLAQCLIEQRSNLTMNDWLTRGLCRNEAVRSKMYGDSNGVSITFFGENQVVLDKGSSSMSLPMRMHEIIVIKAKNEEIASRVRTAAAYEKIVDWIGPSRGNELTSETVEKMEGFLKPFDKSFPLLQSAMDKFRLSLVVSAESLAEPLSIENHPPGSDQVRKRSRTL